jgi:hypothetical protein
MQIKIPKVITIILVALTLFGILLCVSHFEMGRHANGQLVDCLFIPEHTAICSIPLIGHIQTLLNTFVILPAKDALTFFSILLSLLVLLKLRDKFSIQDSLRFDSYTDLFYVNRVPIFDYLKEAFSRGILNPKIF